MVEPRQLIASVWPTGADGLPTQLADRRYVERTRTDHHAIPPAIVEYAITALSQPGDIVLDPDCGAGTTIVESLRAGRHTIGLTDRARWWRVARANVTAAKASGAAPDGMVLVLNRRTNTLTGAATAGLTGRVALILTALRPAPADIDPVHRLRTLLAEARPLLRPGGHVVITARPARNPTTGELLDRLNQIHTAGTVPGLVPIKRCVALTAAIHGHRVAPHVDQHRAHLEPAKAALSGHRPMVVFRADPADNVAVLAAPFPPLQRPSMLERAA